MNAHRTCAFPFIDVARRTGEHGHPVFVVRGELDISTASVLETALTEAAGQAAGPIGVDLRGVRFMDASGLSALIKVDNLARRHGGRLRITASSGPVDRLLGITRLKARFDEPPWGPALTR